VFSLHLHIGGSGLTSELFFYPWVRAIKGGSGNKCQRFLWRQPQGRYGVSVGEYPFIKSGLSSCSVFTKVRPGLNVSYPLNPCLHAIISTGGFPFVMLPCLLVPRLQGELEPMWPGSFQVSPFSVDRRNIANRGRELKVSGGKPTAIFSTPNWPLTTMDNT